ncbi:MAG: DUF4869 domain-containing protein [Treponema sp.]|nr:DUF4869 domain-containing protein [Treponema sp.]
MLQIQYGNMPNEIYNTSVYFNNSYLDSWITNPLSKEIIKKIDKAEVLSSQAVDSKALGVIPITQISGGTKTLLLILNEPEKVFNASTCGNNCAKYILKIADSLDKDVTITLHHLMDFGNGTFEIKILNSGIIVHNMKELVLNSLDFITPED